MTKVKVIFFNFFKFEKKKIFQSSLLTSQSVFNHPEASRTAEAASLPSSPLSGDSWRLWDRWVEAALSKLASRNLLRSSKAHLPLAPLRRSTSSRRLTGRCISTGLRSRRRWTNAPSASGFRNSPTGVTLFKDFVAAIPLRDLAVKLQFCDFL